MDLASIVRSKADFLIGMRRRIHAHPELSGREFETAALVREELTKAGIEWRPCGLQTLQVVKRSLKAQKRSRHFS